MFPFHPGIPLIYNYECLSVLKKRPSLVCTFFCYIFTHLAEKSQQYPGHSITQGAAGEGLHIFIWRLQSSESHFTTLSNTCRGDNDHGCTAPTQLTLIMRFWTTSMHIDSGGGGKPEVEEGGCRRGGRSTESLSVCFSSFCGGWWISRLFAIWCVQSITSTGALMCSGALRLNSTLAGSVIWRILMNVDVSCRCSPASLIHISFSSHII